jgi:branched-chain amino acid transport system permease protein
VAGVITGLFSMAIGYPTFKLHNIYYSFATFAILLALLTLFKNFKTIGGIRLGGAEGYKIPTGDSPANMQFTSKLPYYYIILALLVIILLVSYYLSHSKRGFYFRAISANMEAASSLGVNVMSLKLQAQFISAFFFAVGGGFYCMFMNYIDPSKLFGNDLSINIMVMCVVGGANTLWGPVLGAGLMYTVNRVVTIYASSISGLANIVFGVVLMAVVLFMPGGLLPYFGEMREARAAARRKSELQAEAKGGSQQ